MTNKKGIVQKAIDVDIQMRPVVCASNKCPAIMWYALHRCDLLPSCSAAIYVELHVRPVQREANVIAPIIRIKLNFSDKDLVCMVHPGLYPKGDAKCPIWML